MAFSVAIGRCTLVKRFSFLRSAAKNGYVTRDRQPAAPTPGIYPDRPAAKKI